MALVPCCLVVGEELVREVGMGVIGYLKYLFGKDSRTDYERAVGLGLTDKNRWEDDIDHHPMSERLMAFLKDHDFQDYDDFFCWKSGGDGDNGEVLMYEMDAFFELMEKGG